MKWTKSSRSYENGHCVEVATADDDHILIRDSKDPDELVLAFTAAEWGTFIVGVKDGEFDGNEAVPQEVFH